MRRRRFGVILTVLGVVMALFVGFTVYTQMSEAERLRAAIPKARVVIAAADIPARTEIASSMLSVSNVPDELLQTGAATAVEDVVGKFSPTALRKGQVINKQDVGPIAAKNAPSFTIEKGKVMYVMPVAFGGNQFLLAHVNALRSGDRVDLLYTTINAPQGMAPEQREDVRTNPIPFLQTRIMLQDLRIQEIGTYAADGTLVPVSGDPSSADIIFVVKPEEALVLKWLKDAATFYSSSNIEMVLRSPADDERADSNLVINFNYMREKYNLAPPPTAGQTGQ